jgi:hypothetical protein
MNDVNSIQYMYPLIFSIDDNVATQHYISKLESVRVLVPGPSCIGNTLPVKVLSEVSQTLSSLFF